MSLFMSRFRLLLILEATDGFVDDVDAVLDVDPQLTVDQHKRHRPGAQKGVEATVATHVVRPKGAHGQQGQQAHGNASRSRRSADFDLPQPTNLYPTL